MSGDFHTVHNIEKSSTYKSAEAYDFKIVNDDINQL